MLKVNPQYNACASIAYQERQIVHVIQHCQCTLALFNHTDSRIHYKHHVTSEKDNFRLNTHYACDASIMCKPSHWRCLESVLRKIWSLGTTVECFFQKKQCKTRRVKNGVHSLCSAIPCFSYEGLHTPSALHATQMPTWGTLAIQYQIIEYNYEY